MVPGIPQPTNRLMQEKSPYLLQHAANPVDWYPWGDEPFARARHENKPVFLSIGYATCHWCHVMAHECFEDAEVAAALNHDFVAVKVDREERPDIDQVYMAVCQGTTGGGGWPLSIFMTPEGKAFFAGTYFPKHGRQGLIGFLDLLGQIAALWRRDRGRLESAGDQIIAHLSRLNVEQRRAAQPLSNEVLARAFHQLERTFDPEWGGFGGAPKFPAPHQLLFLLAWYRRSRDAAALDMVDRTLTHMRRGGICDQIGFGFHRYAVDAQWRVPHFEKMLYDQALLALAYTQAFLVTGNARHGATAEEVLTYVLRDMTGPEGGFYSAEDADSEGREGRFYVWRPEEVRRLLGPEEGDLFCRFYGITPAGNFEAGASIPHMAQSLADFAGQAGLGAPELADRLEHGRRILFAHRRQRVAPLKDDKILTSWNGLMIAALAKAAQAFGRDAYGRAARQAADFVFRSLKPGNGRLLRRYRDGEARHPAFLDDYAFLIWGLIELYETLFDPDLLARALGLCDEMLALFWDEDEGGFFYTAQDTPGLVLRRKEVYDGALPSGNSVAALNLLRLGRLSGRTALEERAERILATFALEVMEQPAAHAQFLAAVDFAAGPSREIVIAGNPDEEATRTMLRAVHRVFLPNKTLHLRPAGSAAERLAGLAPFLREMTPPAEGAAAYVCEGYRCQAPVTRVEDLEALLVPAE